MRRAATRAVLPDELAETLTAQDEEAEQFAIAFIGKLLRLRGVRIDRTQFLRAELLREGVADDLVRLAVSERPAVAGIPTNVLDEIARRSISLETKKSTGLAFAAGLPGGLAMVGTVPADLVQYYVHAFRIMQKLAYLYGWQSLIDDLDTSDDQTVAKFGAFLGVMLGVGSAGAALSGFANTVTQPAVARQIATMGLSKTSFYPAIKQTLKRIGVKITTDSFGKSAAKLVPLAGGVISGGMTFASLKAGSNRLKEHLQSLPPAKPAT